MLEGSAGWRILGVARWLALGILVHGLCDEEGHLKRTVLRVVVFAIVAGSLSSLLAQRPASQSPAGGSAVAYFPDRIDWQHRKPEEVGMNAALVSEAVKVAIASEAVTSRDQMLNQATSFGRNEPFDAVIGPMQPRGPASGLITRHGYLVAEWGEPKRVDMTHSVTKTFLTTVVGLAWQRGLIRDVNDYARDYMPPGVDLFEAPHNREIRWDHLLRQSSDWQGTLWGKPDWADRPEGQTSADWPNRKLWEPGTHFKYNDVRVNVLALAALQVLRRPLPAVLREEIMEPIGASSTWRWYGYENSWIEIDGQKIQSVSGGGHWGGGMFINAYTTWPASGIWSSGTASGRTVRSCHRSGSRWRARRVRRTPPTGSRTGI